MMYARHGGDFQIEDRSRILRRAAAFGRPLLLPAIGAFLTTIVATVARLLGPLAVRAGIDSGIADGDKGRLTRAALVFLALLALQYVAQRISQYAVAWLGERYLRDLRSRVFRHLMRLDMAFYNRSKSGVLVSRMTSDIEAINEFANEGAVTLITNVLTAIGVAVAMLILDWNLALAVFGIIGVLIGASLVFQHFAGRAYRAVREQIGRVLASLQEGISGVRVVQAFAQEGSQASEFEGVNEDYFRANMQAATAIAWYFPLVNFLRVLGIAVVLLMGGRRVLDGSLTFGSLVVFLLYLDWFFQPIINLANIYNLMQAAIAGLGKLFGLLDTPPAIDEKPEARPLPAPATGEVRFDDVGFSYNPDVPVLAGIDLRIAPGERVAIVGETGAGKSTAARLALRFYDPTEGTVSIDGSDLRDVTLDSRAHTIVLIPQEGFLFNGTLRDNLRYSRPEAGDEEIWAACRAIGIDDWVSELPEGLDTEVRERGGRFSAGERQLVALARATLADPRVIVLDEATSSLDPGTEARVERALAAVLTDRTAIVIAHRLRSAERSDRVVMLVDGRILAIGTHDELLATNADYARLVQVWRRGLLT